MAGFRPRGGHSSGTSIAERLAQPTRATGPEKTGTLASPRRPYSVLLPVGFAVPFPLPGPRWALTPPFHPYRVDLPRKAVFRPIVGEPTITTRRSVFCGTFPEVALAGSWPAPSFRGARTFLPEDEPRSGRPADWRATDGRKDEPGQGLTRPFEGRERHSLSARRAETNCDAAAKRRIEPPERRSVESRQFIPVTRLAAAQ